VQDRGPHGGGKRHVALVLSTDSRVPVSALKAAQSALPGLAVGSDPKVVLDWNMLEQEPSA
jgi:hypothetical protein